MAMLVCAQQATQQPSNFRPQDNQIRVDKAIDSGTINSAVVMGKQIPRINNRSRIGNFHKKSTIQHADPSQRHAYDDELAFNR
jgi:hypothetical protein